MSPMHFGTAKRFVSCRVERVEACRTWRVHLMTSLMSLAANNSCKRFVMNNIIVII